MNTMTPIKIVAYGDCNTLGINECAGNAWPEIVAKALGGKATNLGHTMSTTRELLQYAKSHPPSNYDIATIQYGLVDSWLTFRHSPYVLYYPSNPWRKFLRKLVKKIKKYARILRIHDLLGTECVVPMAEYSRNIESVIASAPHTRFIIVGSAPNLDLPRNPRIESYNAALAALCERHANAVFANPYQHIHRAMDSMFFADGTHLNIAGQAVVAATVLAAVKKD